MLLDDVEFGTVVERPSSSVAGIRRSMRAVSAWLIEKEARETMNAPLISSTISSPLVLRVHSVKSESGVLDANVRALTGVWTPLTQGSGPRTDSWVARVRSHG